MSTPWEEFYRGHKSSFIAMAYRLTGSWAEAEDIVQDTFTSLMETPTSFEHVRNPLPYFRQAVVNRSLNVLKSPRFSRETYPGTWLPEPLFQISSGMDDSVLCEEQVSYAFLVMLERLSPEERAVVVLRESFAVDYQEIASILNKTEAACRKLLSRARKKLNLSGLDEAQVPGDRVSKWVQAFLQASRQGEFSPLLAMIREDAVLWSDGGGKVRSALRPIYTRKRIMAFWNGILRKGALSGNLVPVLLNGDWGLLLYQEGQPVKAIAFEGDADGRIQNMYLVTNPDKLALAPPLSLLVSH
ncbi:MULTISPECIES: sigma-70 family RNA polymerase sigma factor [Paenibacillus]|uniref:sigma-70 family RNA polymerase sigma factor n=1 Tax=Paenibacillus TaxID=44249 RepID=UPI002FE17C2E